MKTIATAFLVSLASGSVSAIVGGEEVFPGMSSYMSFLSLSKGGAPVCGAALIDSCHVLTSASCTLEKPTHVTVGAQSYNSTRNADVFKIVDTRVHPNFYNPNLTYNLAILTLEQNSSFIPVKLPATDDSLTKPMKGDLTTALGWGSTDWINFVGLSDTLQSVELPVIENGACRNATDFPFIDDEYLCAGDVKGKGLSYIDLGGPLVLKDKQNVGEDTVVGVASFAQEGKGEISVYARVSAELSWIQSQLL